MSLSIKDILKLADAVLFDLDGTLIDSMNHHYGIWKDIVAEYGVFLDKREFFLDEGTNINKLMKKYIEIDDQQLIASLVQKKDQAYLESAEFCLMSGAKELLDWLESRGIPLGLVTAASRKRVSVSLPSNFLQRFGAVISGNDTTTGKPDPEPYLLGAQVLGVSTSNTIVFENAPLGVESGNRAGMITVGIGHTLDRNDLRKSYFYYRDFDDLLLDLV